MQTRSFIFTWKCFQVFYPSDDTHDSTISQVSVFYYRSTKIIRTLWIFRLCTNSILQIRYDILAITSIVKTVKKDWTWIEWKVYIKFWGSRYLLLPIPYIFGIEAWNRKLIVHHRLNDNKRIIRFKRRIYLVIYSIRKLEKREITYHVTYGNT